MRWASIALLCVITCAGEATAQVSHQLWGEATIDWLAADRLTYELKTEPKTNPATLDVTPQVTYAVLAWADVLAEVQLEHKADSDSTATPRVGAELHILSRLLSPHPQSQAEREKPPRRRIVVSTLLRFEESQSEWTFRDRFNVAYPLNRPKTTSDGAIYLTQGGNVPGSGDVSAVSGIQRVNPDGTVELLCSQVAGYQLYGPNDLAFGPDGRLYFTESGSEQDFRFDVRSPGRLFAVDGSGASVTGEMLLELPGVYPNGIAFDRDQRLYWTESMAHRVRRLEDGKPVTFCQLSDDHVPDGMAFAADGRLFVATTVAQGVTVISPDGQVLAEITLGEHATNCAFDGPALYVTATGTADIEASERTGTFWRVDTDADGGLELIPGRL